MLQLQGSSGAGDGVNVIRQPDTNFFATFFPIGVPYDLSQGGRLNNIVLRLRSMAIHIENGARRMTYVRGIMSKLKK